MLSSISSSNLLTQARPNLLQKAAGLLPEDDKNATEKTTPATAAANAKADSSKAGGGDETAGKATARKQQRTIVDQRTTDTKAMRITVITYSDGSSDTLQQVKDTEQPAATALPKAFLPSDRGFMIDRTA